jgi:hypothetical protein
MLYTGIEINYVPYGSPGSKNSPAPLGGTSKIKTEQLFPYCRALLKKLLYEIPDQGNMLGLSFPKLLLNICGVF